jgi:hypothetical protein
MRPSIVRIREMRRKNVVGTLITAIILLKRRNA